MEKVILIVHVITAVAIVVLILLQQGKGATMGASFGAGASQTLFGSQGSGNFFSRATAIFATVFFLTSFGLAYLAKESASVDTDVGIPALEETNEVPSVDEEESAVPEVPAAPTESAEENAVPSVPEATADAEPDAAADQVEEQVPEGN